MPFVSYQYIQQTVTSWSCTGTSSSKSKPAYHLGYDLLQNSSTSFSSRPSSMNLESTTEGVSPVLHYLDNFLTIDQVDSATFCNNFTAIQQICHKLGIRLALEKLEGPSHSFTFLWMEIDTICMEARLSQDKMSCISKHLNTWLRKRKATKREILSLVGSLQHASNVVRPGCTFTTWMYSTATRVQELHHFTCLNKDFQSDSH